MQLAALAAPLKRPGRIGQDHTEALAGFRERDEIVDGAPVLDELGVLRLRLLDLPFLDEPAGNAVIGALAVSRDPCLELFAVERSEPLPAR
jgi:hypothetical protein